MEVPNLTSNKKCEFWANKAADCTRADIPEDDDQLVNQIEEMQGWLTEVEEEMEGFFICGRCALSELPAPCRTCGKKHGRNSYPVQTAEAPEHPMCKKRRLE